MRPGQNKRMRGRSGSSNNNRRGPNPLTRSFESNGPDVKIRGTAAHIAEKYVQLARDAHSSGDPVAAESYLQHAEHYLRLIAAAQQQQVQAQQQANGAIVPESEEGYDGEDEFESSVMDRFTFRAPQTPGMPEPVEQPPRQEYQPRQDQPRQDQPRQDQPRGDQPRHERQDNRPENRGERPFNENRNRNEFRRERPFDRQNANQPRFDRPQPVVEAVEGETALPSFITAPVRVPIETPQQPGMGEQPDLPENPLAAEEGFNRFPLRARRRRPRRGAGAEGAEGAEGGEAAPAPATENTPGE